MSSDFMHHLERAVLWACRLEVLAPKPGNVHPSASFTDLHCRDFLRSAELVASILALSSKTGIGKAILSAINATRAEVSSNTNLGIVLLIAPLASLPAEVPLKNGISSRLHELTLQDSADVYEAIRRAQPGGMGKVSDQDVNDAPTVTLLEAMRMAADRDTIAAQYANDYRLIFEALDFWQPETSFPEHWESEIVRLALWIHAQVPDSLIARKCGLEVAQEASRRAAETLASWNDLSQRESKLAELDGWLRADGHRRNPGTTADLVAAVLFAAFRDRILPTADTWPQPPSLEIAP